MDVVVFMSGNEWRAVARIFLAALAGAAIGWNRQMKGKPAGLRTHMLVSVGAACVQPIGGNVQSGLDNLRGDENRLNRRAAPEGFARPCLNLRSVSGQEPTVQ